MNDSVRCCRLQIAPLRFSLSSYEGQEFGRCSQCHLKLYFRQVNGMAHCDKLLNAPLRFSIILNNEGNWVLEGYFGGVGEVVKFFFKIEKNEVVFDFLCFCYKKRKKKKKTKVLRKVFVKTKKNVGF
jgi:hypothetical protein